MFFKVLSHFQDDRKKIIIILVCIGVIVLFYITLVNNWEKSKKDNSSSSDNTTTAIITNDDKLKLKEKNGTSNNSNNIEFEETSINSPENVIKAFTIYCNKKEIENAYNLLTDDCKKYVFPTQEDFVNNYYNGKFSDGNKDLSYMQYGDKEDNIYRIYVNSDPLISGNADDSVETVDYIVAVRENTTYKINIGGFIKKVTFNDKKNENYYIKADVKEKLIFMDYEIYNIDFENLIDANINLTETLSTNNVYVQSKEQQKYYLVNDDYIEQDLLLESKSKKTFSLKFNKSYMSNDVQIYKMVFNDIKIINRKNYDNTIQTQISDGEIRYGEKYTTYPTNIKLEIQLNNNVKDEDNEINKR